MESLLTKPFPQGRVRIVECQICGYSTMWVDGDSKKCPKCRNGVLRRPLCWTQTPKIEGNYWFDRIGMITPHLGYIRPPVPFNEDNWYYGPISCPERCPAVREVQCKAQKREEKKS